MKPPITYEYPSDVEGREDEGGQEGDEYEDHVGQVQGGVVLVALDYRVPHHPTEVQR